MDQKSLRERLAKLHAELADARSNKILRRGNRSARCCRTSNAWSISRLMRLRRLPTRSLPTRLERVAVQFEAEHPTLAASARRLIDLLSEVGI